ncbi:hypothetical protein HMI55_000529 [Coelomomyces lativittatus]|nr:hypothetical protein HMI55_000529 [Coelomomyces lativittatus]
MSIQSRVCNLLKSWTKDSSFLNPSGKALIQEILTFTQHIMGPDRQHVIGKQIRKNLMKLRTHDHPKIPLANLEISSSFVNPQGLFQSPPFKVAKEFCNYMFHIYAAISPAELLNQRWMKTGALENAPNVTLLSQKFNNLARWFIKSILIIKDLQQRASRMEWIVEVASYLFEHKNFIVLMSALAGLGNSSVSRLKYTKARMAGRYRKKLEELEEVMDPKNSYKAYRASLREPKQDGTVSRIPYLAVHLSDLVYVEDGNPDQIQRLTNFAKRKLMYTVINEILQHQSSPYNFEPSSNVLQRWVTHCFNYTADQKEEELFKISLLLEPRGWDGVSPFPEKEATKSS